MLAKLRKMLGFHGDSVFGAATPAYLPAAQRPPSLQRAGGPINPALVAGRQPGFALPWWAGVPGSHGSLIGPQPAPGTRALGYRPPKRSTQQFQKYYAPAAGHHGDLTIAHSPSGAVTITHQPHGDSGGPGDTDPNEPNFEPSDDYENPYGTGSTGISARGTLDVSGADPLGVSGFLPPIDMPHEALDLEIFADPMVAYRYEPTSRIPTRRNPLVDFGMDDRFYAAFGPAAIVGCDMGVPADTKLKG